MIVGEGTTAENFRAMFANEIEWLWICDDIGQGSKRYPDLWSKICSYLNRDSNRDVVISSQIQVGTIAKLEEKYPERRFAYIPENFRTIKGDQSHIQKTIIGTRSAQLFHRLAWTFGYSKIIPMTPESAEITKAALNTALALQVQYSAELDSLARKHGADPYEVAGGLMADPRIGQHAYLMPGGRQSDHLRREVASLHELGGGPLIDTLESLCSQ